MQISKFHFIQQCQHDSKNVVELGYVFIAQCPNLVLTNQEELVEDTMVGGSLGCRNNEMVELGDPAWRKQDNE